jgi:outer membrane protein insertion porin family
MNRHVLLVAAIQLLVVSAGTQAQTTSSAVSVFDCAAASNSQATLKRQQTSRDKRSVEEQAVVDNGRRPSFQENLNAAPKHQEVEFIGLTVLKESEALKLVCERNTSSTDRKPDFDATSAASALTEVLKSRGYANAEVRPFVEQDTIRFFVNEGMRVPLAELRFEGNKVFSNPELLTMTNVCLARVGEGPSGYDSEKLEYCGRRVADQIRDAGYLEAKLQSTTKRAAKGYAVTFALDEGILYRLGKIKIEGGEVFTEDEIKAKFGLREGDIAKGNSISKWLFEDLKNAYGELGFIEYMADVSPTFKREQGLVDLKIDIEEGKQFSLRSVTFKGDLIKGVNLEDPLVLKPGEIYNHRLLRESIARLNQINLFETIDADKDVDITKDDEEALVRVVIKLKKRE